MSVSIWYIGYISNWYVFIYISEIQKVVRMIITEFLAMTPLEYVNKHISITSGCKLLYNTVFNRHKRNVDEEDTESQDRRMYGEVDVIQILKYRHYIYISYLIVITNIYYLIV